MQLEHVSMKPSVFKVEVPKLSEISAQLNGAYYFDSYKTYASNTERFALDFYLDIISKTPAWVNCLMYLRNKIVSIFGLKDLGNLGEIDPTKPGSKYCIGDRVGIFSVLSISKQEAILGVSDKHLDVKLSVYKVNENEKTAVTISTVVHVHNIFGRIYMWVVTPVHKIISPAMLRLACVENNNA